MTTHPELREHRDELLKALHHVRFIITEAAMTGFNYKEGDWTARLYKSQAITKAAIDFLEKPKLVKVWRIEYSQNGSPECTVRNSLEAANAFANELRKGYSVYAGIACINIKEDSQEVPNNAN